MTYSAMRERGVTVNVGREFQTMLDNAGHCALTFSMPVLLIFPPPFLSLSLSLYLLRSR